MTTFWLSDLLNFFCTTCFDLLALITCWLRLNFILIRTDLLFISIEAALRKPLTYDDYPVQSHPTPSFCSPSSRKAQNDFRRTRKISHELGWTNMNQYVNVSDQTSTFTHEIKMLTSICWIYFLAFNVPDMTKRDGWIQNFWKKET